MAEVVPVAELDAEPARRALAAARPDHHAVPRRRGPVHPRRAGGRRHANCRSTTTTSGASTSRATTRRTAARNISARRTSSGCAALVQRLQDPHLHRDGLPAPHRAGHVAVRAAGPHGLDELPQPAGPGGRVERHPGQGAAGRPGDLPQRRPEGELPRPPARRAPRPGGGTGRPAPLQSRPSRRSCTPGTASTPTAASTSRTCRIDRRAAACHAAGDGVALERAEPGGSRRARSTTAERSWD